jgi:H+-translocating diphosphatase
MVFFIVLIVACCAAGLVWAVLNAQEVLKINLAANDPANEHEIRGIDAMMKIGEKISNGADAFLGQEYRIISVFVVFFGALVFVLVDYMGNSSGGVRFYATVAYVVGSITSMVCGYIGMKIAVKSNFRTTYKAITSLSEAFKTAFRAGCVMGFSMIPLSLLILIILFEVYKSMFKPNFDIKDDKQSYAVLMELLAAYGLGGSSIALFGRVGGGIYTKAADVGADLVGKVEENLAEDSPRNPATIADNVGDNVGDIAGMGADLFGSFAESTCAALVFIASCKPLLEANDGRALYFPMLISAFGIVACILSSAYGIFFYTVDSFDLIEKALKLQLVLSTVLILVVIPVAGFMTLPKEWVIGANRTGTGIQTGTAFKAIICVAMGLISGLIIGYSTDYYTSNAHAPVQEMAQACKAGPAINIIYGLALGYNSTVIPVIALAITVITSITYCGLFGVALAAIGMLSNLCVGLAIDAYGPISDNAGGKPISYLRNRRDVRNRRRS